MHRNLVLLAIGTVAATTVRCARSTPSQARPTSESLLLHPEHAEWKKAAPPVSRLRFETTKGVFVLEAVRAFGPIGVDRLFNLARLG